MSGDFLIQTEIRTHDLIKFGKNKKAIYRILRSEFPVEQIDDMLLDEVICKTCDDYPDYERIQFFMHSKVVIDKDGNENKYYLVNHLAKKIETIDKNVLSQIIHPKLRWDSRRYTCTFVYNPYIPFIVRKVEGEWNYNTYEPPKWQRDVFYSQGSLSVPYRKELPSLYKTFFNHLVDGHVDSFNYIVSWLANMIQGRNYCILTTIGNQGIGKGLLGDIMKNLVGEHNYHYTGKRLLEKDFNAAVSNKRLVYIDEVSVNSVDQENKLKALINDHIEVEKKGIDSYYSKNYSSYYFSSNNKNALRIPADDRRFSIIELTNTKLINIMPKESISKLLDEDNTKDLAEYLSHYKIDHQKMMEVFKTNRTEMLRSYTLNIWQEWFIEEYCLDKSGKTIPIREVSADVEHEFGSKTRPSRRALESLYDIYPNKFKLVNKRTSNGRQTWCVEFAEVGID